MKDSPNTSKMSFGETEVDVRANMKLSAAIDKVIELAKVIHAYWETELPKRHPDYPIANPGEEPVPPPPEEKKLAKLLASLPADMVYQIGLIAELGQRQFSVSDVSDSCNLQRVL